MFFVSSCSIFKGTMTKPDADKPAEALVAAAGIAGSKPAEPPVRPTKPPSPTNARTENIHVSPAVLEAARKDGEELLRDLRTSLGGLTQAEAEERARTTGPNEVAQERKEGWPVRLLKIIRNPLVILLTTLSAISFVTGDARAGSVMAIMVALSVGLRFWQEARADAAAEKLKAMIHVTATAIRDGVAKEMPLRDPCQQRSSVSRIRRERRNAHMPNTKQTSTRVASEASRLLSNPKTPKPIRSVAASDLAQARGGRKK
jgi:hypothetical protein